MDLSDPGQAKPILLHIERITGISTYGRPRWQAIGMADPPRKVIKRYLPWFTGGKAKVRYYALYHMNTATLARRTKLPRQSQAGNGAVLAGSRSPDERSDIRDFCGPGYRFAHPSYAPRADRALLRNCPVIAR